MSVPAVLSGGAGWGGGRGGVGWGAGLSVDSRRAAKLFGLAFQAFQLVVD